MPNFDHHGAHIYYEGVPARISDPDLRARRSAIGDCPIPGATLAQPINPTKSRAAEYRVICCAMDQRNAGQKSRAPITAHDGWDAYTADHVALLDHLRIDKCHLYGQCIGGSFIINMLKHHPERGCNPWSWRSRSGASAR